MKRYPILAATIQLLLATAAANATIITPESSDSDLTNNNNNNNKKLRGSTRSLSLREPMREPSREDREPLWEEPARIRPLSLPVSPGIAAGYAAEDLPCLMATVCERPELSILCGFLTSNLDEWMATTGGNNFFLDEAEGGSSGTFLAPVDGAFNASTGSSIMTNILVNDLSDPSVLQNVMSYHVVPISNSNATTTATTTTTTGTSADDVLLALEDFDCNGELAMANGQSTSTFCGSGGLVRYQYGSGNRVLRTLPEIKIEGIDACDATVVIHFVDKLILPGLPLEGMPEAVDEDDPSLAVEDTVLEDEETGVSVGPVVEVGAEDACPIDVPDLFSDCWALNESCDYGFSYDGCTWDQLECTPSMTCTCVDTGTEGMSGSWTCVHKLRPPCKPQFFPEAVPFIVAEGRQVDIPTKNPRDPNEMPIGECNPNLPLPRAPDDDQDAAPATQCPLRAPRPFSDSCDGYEVGQTCNYGHVFTGCDWDELSCTWTKSCNCMPQGFWACAMASIAACPKVTEFDEDIGRDVVVSPPRDLPWGTLCDPDQDPPTGPPPPTDDTTVDGRPSDECPEKDELTTCAGYEDQLTCNYDYMYTGCTWDELNCTPLMKCRCDQSFTSEGGWACLSRYIAPCQSKPEGHPFGQYCDPTAPLPLPSKEEEGGDAVDGRLSDECPAEAMYGESCAGFVDDLTCDYDYIYGGCTWNELSCFPVVSCSCDGNWQCMSMAMVPCDSEPEGLPAFQSCDPGAPLPTENTVAVIGRSEAQKQTGLISGSWGEVP